MSFWKEDSCTLCIHLCLPLTTSLFCVWYFKLDYLPVLICLSCLDKLSWCLLASLHVAKNTSLRATGFNQNKHWRQIVAGHLDTRCYKQIMNIECTAHFSYSVSSFAGALSVWVFSNLLFLFLHAFVDSERGKWFSFSHYSLCLSFQHAPNSAHISLLVNTVIQKLNCNEVHLCLCHLFSLLLTVLSSWTVCFFSVSQALKY